MFHILIVEDNPLFSRILVATLLAEFSDMKMSTADTAEAAWLLIEKEPPDIAFVDIRLPGENGLELTKRIKARLPGTIVIILTSYDLPEYRRAAGEIGCDHFLLKGDATNEEVVALVKSILSKPKTPVDQTNLE
jgi:DNA-binding NarL/FixJ family response regulator